VDLKGRNIRVNVLSSDTIDTAILEGKPREELNYFVSMIPCGTTGWPEAVASAWLSLASSDSSFVTGIELFVEMVASLRGARRPGPPFTCFPEPPAYSQGVAFERRTVR
jgi:NAD(P)-dependent dehydrogenase (short-subunit alcohol dehydrogenase family)